MDVISGTVPRQDGYPFQPSDLVGLWHSHGAAWVQLHSKLSAAGKGVPTAACCLLRLKK